MGFTSEQQQREEILAAIDHMAWTATPARPHYLDGPAIRAIVNAVFHATLGTRSYVLDLDAEAIYVLAEFTTHSPPPTTPTSQTRVA